MPTVRVQCPLEQVKVWSVRAEVTASHSGEDCLVAVACGLVDMIDLAKAQLTLVTVAYGLVCRGQAAGDAPVTWRCTRYVAVHPNRRGVMPTVRVRCLLEQVKMWSAVARSGLCGLMGVCVVVPGGGFRQTVDPFTKIPRNLAVFAQWVCTLAEWMLHRYGCASWSVLGTQICGVGWSVGVWNGLVVVSILPRKRIRDKACC